MKSAIIIIILLFCNLLLLGQTAEEVLSGKHVIAYTCASGLYLMDIDTGKKVRVSNFTSMETVFWDKSGTRLFWLDTHVSDDNPVCDVTIHEVLLPSLEDKIMDMAMLDLTDIEDFDFKLSEDNRIYYIGISRHYDFDGNLLQKEYHNLGYFDIGTGESHYAESEDAGLPSFYPDQGSYIVYHKGYRIVDTRIFDPGFMHWELSVEGDMGGPKQLTNFGPKQDNINLRDKPLEYSVSPNDKMLVYSYEYYVDGPADNYSYTCLTSLDGKKHKFLTKPLGVKTPDCFVWTADDRLVYTHYSTGKKDMQSLRIIDTKLHEKILAYLEPEDVAQISYRNK